MSTSPGALPAAPVGIGADPDAQKEYIDALNKQLAALEDRQGFNLFNLAGAFLNPGRTGSFGEALGNAATSLGVDLQRQEARELPIAQMRAQIAGQKYEMQNKEKAYGMVANAMGMGSAEDVARALSTGQGLVGLSTKFTPELYIALSRVDPKIAEYVKNAAGMDIERFKAINEAAKTNIDITKLYQQFGKKAVDYFMNINGGTLPRPSAPASSGAPTATGAPSPTGTAKPQGTTEPAPRVIRDKDGNVVDLDVTAQPAPEDDQPTVVQGQPVVRPKKEGTGEGPSIVPKESTLPANAPQFGYTEVAPGKYKLLYSGRIFPVPEDAPPELVNKMLEKAVETEQAIYKNAIESEAKPWQEKQAELMKYDNQATVQNLNRVDGIIKILRNEKYRDIVGILQNADQESVKSWIQAVGAAMQEGLKLGNYGSLSVPIEKFISTGSLDLNQKKALGELSRLINSEFLAGMKANRGLLGVNPTDNDARLFQASMAGTGNLAENILSWVQGRAAEYETMNKMYNGYVQHRKQYGVGDPASYFTLESSPYHSAVKDYASTMSRVMANSPGIAQ